MKTIYNTYVVMESQEQCDRMKQLCIDNGLPINKEEWDYHSIYGNQFYHTEFYQDDGGTGFCIFFKSEHSTQITEQEFIELLNNK